jgi:ATPase inhibitor subunit zeta
MTSLEQRENAYEAEFAHGEELKFKAREGAVRLLAIWAAGRLARRAKRPMRSPPSWWRPMSPIPRAFRRSSASPPRWLRQASAGPKWVK